MCNNDKLLKKVDKEEIKNIVDLIKGRIELLKSQGKD